MFTMYTSAVLSSDGTRQLCMPTLHICNVSVPGTVTSVLVAWRCDDTSAAMHCAVASARLCESPAPGWERKT